jgi:hypothetical protein
VTFLRDPADQGRARRFWRIYREKRRDQAPNHPTVTMRMSRRTAFQLARHQSAHGGGARELRE